MPTPPTAIDLRQTLSTAQITMATDAQCRVDTLEDLQFFLMPALSVREVIHTQRTVEGQRYHLLTYTSATAQQQRVVIAPGEIWDSELNRECVLNPSLARYLGIAIEATVAQPHKEEEVPNVATITSYQKLASTAIAAKLKLLYLQKCALLTLTLAKSVRSKTQGDATLKEVDDVIARYTPQLKCQDEKPMEEEVLRFDKLTRQFLETLLRTSAWQTQQRRSTTKVVTDNSR